MMKPTICPYCGASVTNTKCEYCGQPLSKNIETPILAPKNSTFKKILKMLCKKIFTPYSIISSILWTCCCLFNISSIVDDGPDVYFGVSLFGYAFFILIANILYYKKHPIRNETTKVINNTPPPTTTGQAYNLARPFDLMDGHEFEYFCADILKANGFKNVEVTKGSGDQGLDIIAYRDDVKYGIQCKCYSSDIGNKAVQEAFAGKTYYGCHVAAVLTNRYFTKSARELAERNGVLLWDRNKLIELIENKL